MTPRKMIFVAVLLSVAGSAAPAMAYVGPGAGLSVLSALFGVLAAIGAAIVFIVGWPVRRFLRKRKKQQSAVARGEAQAFNEARSRSGQ